MKFNLFNQKPKILDDETFEQEGIYFHLNYKEGKPLITSSGKPTSTFKDYVHTFFIKKIEPIRQEFFNSKILSQTNPELQFVFNNIFKLFYEELINLTKYKGLQFIHESSWESAIEKYIKSYTESDIVEKAAKQKLQTMEEQHLKRLLHEVVGDIIANVENTYQQRLNILKAQQEAVLAKVASIQVDTTTFAREVATTQTKSTFNREKDSLMKSLFTIDDAFLQKDKTKAFYYENRKKKQELEERERDLHYRDRELSVREKEFGLSHREKELAFSIIEKDLEIQRKSIELIQKLNLHELNKKQLEVAYSLLQVEKQGVAQAKDLIAVEKSLLEIKNSQVEDRVRALKLNIQEQKFNMQQLKAKMDYQQRKVNIGSVILQAKQDLNQLEEKKKSTFSELRHYNLQLHDARDNYNYYHNEKERLKNEIQRLKAAKNNA